MFAEAERLRYRETLEAILDELTRPTKKAVAKVVRMARLALVDVPADHSSGDLDKVFPEGT
jgi:hypothetical protein